MKTFRCTQCRQTVYFANVRCESCESVLGFLPEERTMATFKPAPTGEWTRVGGEDLRAYRPCRNYAEQNVCNWMVPAESPEAYCTSCRLNQVIPNLTKPENWAHWYKLELAKRRLIHSLQGLGLPVRNRIEDPTGGLAFRFLEDVADKERILTGHAQGVITLNIAEADDAKREQVRAAMHEPYRTLLGHFRHEIGHYYWDRLIRNTTLHEPFRRLFGDERANYSAALQKHYEAGPPWNWKRNYITAYAASHPWEDWAECFAHYLHMTEGLNTAEHWGLRLDPADPEQAPVEKVSIHGHAKDFDTLLFAQWLPLTRFLNSLNRSLGHHDAYPFRIAAPVVEKLRFIDGVLREGMWRQAAPMETALAAGR